MRMKCPHCCGRWVQPAEKKEVERKKPSGKAIVPFLAMAMLNAKGTEKCIGK